MQTLFISILLAFSIHSFADEAKPTATPAPKEAAHSTALFGENEGFSLGPILGADIGSMAFDPDPGTHSGRFGALTGGFFELKLGSLFGLYTEVAYVQHGYQMGTSYIFPDARYNYDFIEFPVLAKVKFGLGTRQRVHLFFVAGPNFGIRTLAEVKTTGATTDISGNTESLNIAVDSGMGVEVWLSQKFALTGMLRLAVGLTDLNKSATASAKTVDLKTILAAKFSL